MKNLISIFAVSLLITSCGDSKKDTEYATQRLLDSVKAVNAVNRAIDSVNQLNNSAAVAVESVPVEVTQPTNNNGTSKPKNTQGSNTNPKANATTNATIPTSGNATESGVSMSPGGNVETAAAPASAPTTPEKKGASNTTKGALIGAGAGVVTGAAAGALINKGDPKKGAVIGGLIGGAVGSGVGLGAGAVKDKKDNAAATSTVK